MLLSFTKLTSLLKVSIYIL